MRPKIYITQPVAPSAIERLRAIADVEVNPDTLHKVTKEELLEKVPHLDILFCLLHDRIDRDVISAAPRLRMIASMKITPSDIDVEAASARRLPVTVISPIVTEATADIHFALLLAVARRVLEGDQLLRAGIFPGAQSAHLLGAWVHDRTIGLIGGGGRIGRAVAKRAQGFSMRTLYWTPRRKTESEEQAAGLTYVSYDQLLAESDFVSVHAPLNAETRHLVGERELSLMKPTAFLINSARGPIVDEAALVAALRERRIAGAALDVYDQEPLPAGHPLMALDNAVLTPHSGFVTAETYASFFGGAVDQILAFLDGKTPPRALNPDARRAR
jgi:glyoxylate reductase